MSWFDFIDYQRLDRVPGQQTSNLQPEQITVTSRAVHVDKNHQRRPIVARHTPTLVFYLNKTYPALSGSFTQQVAPSSGRLGLNSNAGLGQIHLIASTFIIGRCCGLCV
jgi:hypothetical protein